jgi:hypothetical protein
VAGHVAVAGEAAIAIATSGAVGGAIDLSGRDANRGTFIPVTFPPPPTFYGEDYPLVIVTLAVSLRIPHFAVSFFSSTKR